MSERQFTLLDLERPEAAEQLTLTFSRITRRLLQWTAYRDCVHEVTRFLEILIKSVYDVCCDTNPEAPSFWQEPLLNHVEGYPERFDVLEDHLLHALLQADRRGGNSLLKILPLNTIEAGNSGKVPQGSIRLCLFVAHTMWNSRDSASHQGPYHFQDEKPL